MTGLLARYEQTKQTFLHARSYATAWDFMEAAIATRLEVKGREGSDEFESRLLDWALDKLIEAEHEQRPQAA